ncbi:MAG: PEP-utilizing enzyme [bacterium]
MKTYIKFYNRSLPIYAVQYWFRGESFETKMLLGASGAPLFYYEDKKATSVYYEKTELANASKKLTDYYIQNPDELENGIRQYKKLHQDSLVAIQQKNPASLFAIAVKMWPTLNSIMFLGELESAHPTILKLKDNAIQARAETDRFIYNIGNGIWDSIDPSVPEEVRSFLTIEEIVSKKYPTPDEIGRREKNYIYTQDALIAGISLSDFAKKQNFIFQAEQPSEDIREFSGEVACAGKVTGKVRKVLEFRDMFKFHEGEVLVSPMTVPDFLPVMKKAIAFITDEGGITCHAAIIAREMNKPCIIGTKIATQVLKDGDSVEVDANTGKIRIL